MPWGCPWPACWTRTCRRACPCTQCPGHLQCTSPAHTQDHHQDRGQTSVMGPDMRNEARQACHSGNFPTSHCSDSILLSVHWYCTTVLVCIFSHESESSKLATVQYSGITLLRLDLVHVITLHNDSCSHLHASVRKQLTSPATARLSQPKRLLGKVQVPSATVLQEPRLSTHFRGS